MADLPQAGNGSRPPSPFSPSSTLPVTGSLNASQELPDSPASSVAPADPLPAVSGAMPAVTPTVPPPATSTIPGPAKPVEALKAPGVASVTPLVTPAQGSIPPGGTLPTPRAPHSSPLKMIVWLILILVILGGGYYAYAQGLIPGINQEQELLASPSPSIVPTALPLATIEPSPTLTPTPSATPLTGDAKRIQDIDAIALALDKYAADNNQSVPKTPATGIILKDNTSDVARALVPLYLATMPADEIGGGGYGFVSDGTKYILRVSVAATEPLGQKSGDKYYYTIEGPRAVVATPTPVPSSSTTDTQSIDSQSTSSFGPGA